MKFGIIGCGAVTEYGHLPALNSLDGAEVMALCDINRSRLEGLAGQYHVKNTFTGYKDLLGLEELDTVVVATRIESHYPIVLDALRAGKHVLCEKPIADTVKKGWIMVEESEKTNKVLAVNFELRFGEVEREIKRHLDAGSIGEPKVFRLSYVWSAHGAQAVRRDLFMKTGGGPIVNNGIHFFDMVRWITGKEFKEVKAEGSWVEENYDTPDYVLATVRLDDNSLAIIEQSCAYTHTSKEKDVLLEYNILGTDGSISYNYNTKKLRVFTRDNTIEKEMDWGKNFSGVYKEFMRCVGKGNTDDSMLGTGEDGVIALEAALKALETAKKKR